MQTERQLFFQYELLFHSLSVFNKRVTFSVHVKTVVSVALERKEALELTHLCVGWPPPNTRSMRYLTLC